MKINQKLLSIPPYISTSWKNVTSLHLESRDDETLLVVGLNNGTCIEIPHLEQEVIEAIFTIHTKVIEQESPFPRGLATVAKKEQSLSFGFPLPVSLENLEQLGTFLQHTSEQSQADDLPSEVLHKVSSLAKTIGFEETDDLPKAEPHCNCPHCQIARALHGGIEERKHEGEKKSFSQEGFEEIVDEEDLHFRSWDINKTSEKLYRVVNPMNNKECYNVYLGEPIGCTCGQKNCEHVRAVLNC